MNQTDQPSSPKEREERFLETLRRQPAMMERFEAILELTGGREGTIGHAGQIEELLVAEVRKLSHRAMQDWAVGAEARAAERLPREVPGTRIYKKSPELVVLLRKRHHPETHLAGTGPRLPAGLQHAGRHPRTRKIAAPAAGDERLLGRAFLWQKLPANQRALRICNQRHGRARDDPGARRAGARTTRSAQRKELPRTAPKRPRRDRGADRWNHDLHRGRRARGSVLRSRLHQRRANRTAARPLRARRRMGTGEPPPRRGRRSRMDPPPNARSPRRPRPPARGLLPLRQAQGLRHVSESLAAAAAIRPGGERAWLRTQQKRLKRGAHQAVLEVLSRFYKLHNQTCHFPQSCCAAG